MAVSTDFAPPFKLIAPYFIVGMLFFVSSIVLLFGFDISTLDTNNSLTLSWVHIFLLGFVMMVIFGAMAQLVPVVLEVGHFAVELYYVIYPLLAIGALMMSFGFYTSAALLPYGGVIVLVALLIFVLETFLTIKKQKNLNLVMKSVLLANSFLFLGLVFGILMALGFAGTIEIDISNFLKAHIYMVLAGYVGVTIMGMSLVLLPMFWLSHSFSWKPIEYALYTITTSIFMVMFSALFQNSLLEYTGYTLTIFAFMLYFYQIWLIYKTRVRLDNDIYLHSLLFAYSALLIGLVFGIFYLFHPLNRVLLTFGWLMLAGFITFMINGHLYKIVPFLVWYQRFSPLIGKQKVPMLADMVPKQSAKIQFLFSSSGVIIITIGLLLGNNEVFKSGVSFLFMGSVFMLKDLLYMINFK